MSGLRCWLTVFVRTARGCAQHQTETDEQTRNRDPASTRIQCTSVSARSSETREQRAIALSQQSFAPYEDARPPAPPRVVVSIGRPPPILLKVRSRFSSFKPVLSDQNRNVP